MQRINEEIINKKVRIVGGTYNDEMPLEKALDIAYNLNLDLVEVNENNGLSICKIMNYSKYLYEQKKAKKPQKKSVVKEIKLGCNIAEHDIKISVKKALNILNNGDKVKVIVVFKGRQMAFINQFGPEVLNKFLSFIEDSDINVVKPPKMEGNSYSMMIEKK